jgi:adenylate kinase
VIRARIAEYHKKTATVADHYKKAHKVVMVKGEGTVEEIFERLSKEINRLMKIENC